MTPLEQLAERVKTLHAGMEVKFDSAWAAGGTSFIDVVWNGRHVLSIGWRPGKFGFCTDEKPGYGEGWGCKCPDDDLEEAIRIVWVILREVVVGR